MCNSDSDSSVITVICHVRHSHCMTLNVILYSTSELVHRGAWRPALVLLQPRGGLVERDRKQLRERRERERERERERVRQALTHAPAPYMHPIHSYLVPVTRWLQNGIDYWFPPYYRSVVVAGYSGLTESPVWDNKRGGGEERRGEERSLAREHTHTHRWQTHQHKFTFVLTTVVLWDCVKAALKEGVHYDTCSVTHLGTRQRFWRQEKSGKVK